MKDGKQQETTFVYDGFNRLTSQTFANGDTTSFTYNAVQKLSQTSPRGITTTYTYDVRDRVTATSAPGLQRNHSYDVAGRLLSVSEPANPAANVSYTYDVLGRVLSETSRGITHSYSYDIAGNRTQASYGTGRVVQTSYDALNRPESLVEGGRTTSYGYDLGGRAVLLKAGNGQTSRNVYDELGRLKQRTLFRTQAMTAGEELAQFEWTHDLLGNVTSQSETWPGEPTRPGVRTTSMAYDANNRLTHETIDDPSAGVTTTAYAYDNANNRSSKQVTGGTEPGVWSYVYNAANQLTSWEKQLNGSPVKNAALTYDAAGNRIAQSVSENGNAQSTLYTWDSQDRLSSVTMPDGSEHAYKYDYRTRRISTTRGGTLASMATAILFAGGLSLAEWEVAGSVPAMANTPTVEYTRGPDMGGGVGGMLYSLRSGQSSNTPTLRYSLSNGRGDIVAQADQAATLTWTASYEAYGKRTKETGTNADKQRANSKDEDPTGLLNEGFRYRDIETGVWLSRDPAGFVDGPNLYAYVQQNPWTGFDPDGLATKSQLHKERRGLIKRRDAEKAAREKNGEKLTKEVQVGEDVAVMNTEYGNVMNTFNTAIDALKSRIDEIDRAVDVHNGAVDILSRDNNTAAKARLSRVQFDDEDPKNQKYLRQGARASALADDIKWTLLGGAAGKLLNVGGKTFRLLSPGLRLSKKGLGMVENHLSTFEEFAPNTAMLNRLQNAFNDGKKVFGADANFYLHETNEATTIGRLGYDGAHTGALQKYGVKEFDLYHPDVIRADPGNFNNAWRSHWGIPNP